MVLRHTLIGWLALLLVASACDNKRGVDGVSVTPQDSSIAASASDADDAGARDSAVMPTVAVLIAGVGDHVTTHSPPSTVRLTVDNRGASAAAVSIVSVEGTDSGAAKALKITSVESDGGGAKRRDHVVVVGPKQTVMITIAIEGELSPDAERYAFHVGATVDGEPRVVDTVVTRAIRHPLR